MARLIESLVDLQAAADLAARDGECVVRLPNGTTLTLLPGGDTYDDDSDPGLVHVLEQGLDQLESGQSFTTADVLARLQARKKGRHG